MRLSFYQLALLVILCGVSYGHETKGQAVLEKRVSVDVQGVRFKQVLSILEAQAGVRFIYSPNSIDVRRKVSLKADSERLETVLNDLLLPYAIDFSISDEKMISLKRAVLTKGARNQQSEKSGQTDTADNPAREISGRVTDESGAGLPGVSILIKGTQRGMISDASGNFAIDVPDQNAVLVFSFVGYLTKEITVGSRTSLQVSLEVDQKGLEELVVVGFGEKRLRDLTGSISTVNADAISRIGAVSPQFALQGNAPGVRVINTSGNPNEAPQIFIRGIGTWNGDSQPLYVIDGQILEPPRASNEDLIGASGGLRTPPNLFNLINPADIESMTVLKDASAAAVYGSRAANGVVLITTKRGKKGAPKLEFNTSFGIQNAPKFKMLNTEQFVDISREMYTNSANPDHSIERNLYGRDELNDALRLSNFNPQFDPQSPYQIKDMTTYDWQGAMLRSNALNQSYDVKISGATDRMDYYVSGGYYDQEGVIYGNNIKRYTGAANLNVKVTEWAKFGVNYKYTYQSYTNNRAELPALAGAAPWQPVFDPADPYGYAAPMDPYRFGDTWQSIKPYGQGSITNYRAITDLNYSGFETARNLGQFYIELKPLNGLTLRGSLNLDYSQQQGIALNAWSLANRYIPGARDPRLENANAPASLGSYGRRATNVFNYQSDFTATYSRIFSNKHNVMLLAGVQDQRHDMETGDRGTKNLTVFYPNPKRQGWGGDDANTTSLYGWGFRYWFGMVGRASYDYMNKYYLDASYRRDASNGFAKDYRWGNFYSLSGAWRISSEEFFNVPFIDDLKLRGGWGQAGNDQAAVGAYAYLSRVAGHLSSYRFGSGNGNSIGTWYGGALVADLANPALSWEVATTTNLGFDAFLLKNKLNVTFEWYNRATSGILQRVNLPLSAGLTGPLSNIGEMVNKGIDMSAGYEDRIGDFRYNIAGNISFVRNKVTKLYGGQPLSLASGRFEREDAGRVEEGRSVGIIWGYKVGGMFQNQSEIGSHYSNQPDNGVSNTSFVRPGDLYFQDVQGDPPAGAPIYSPNPDGKVNENDRTEIGNTIPGHTYGLNLSVGWKGFDLSTSFYGEGNVDKYNSVRSRFESMAGAGGNYFATTLNRWTPDNTNTDMPRAVVGDPAGNNRFSDRWVESAAFFRLNNWQVGYTLPVSALALVNNKVSFMRLYVGGANNLYAFRWRGIDPVNDAFPLPKTFNAGLSVRF